MLTDKQVKALKPQGKPFEVADGTDYSGLRIRVSPKGKKTFFYRYRHPHTNKLMKLTIGVYGDTTLQQARNQWSDYSELRNTGIDPKSHQDQANTEKAQQQIKAEEEAETQGFTVKKLVREYTKQLTKKSAYKDISILDRTLEPYFNLPAADLKRGDILTILNKLRDQEKFVQANRTLASIRAMYNWSIGQDKLEYNPCTQVKATPEKPKDRHLNDTEIKTFLAERDKLGRFSDVLLFLLLTGCRVSEVTGMRKEELFGNEWRIPSERTKNGHSHTVYLSEYAQSLIPDDLWQVRSDAVTKGLKAAELSLAPFTPHDFRRTLSTWLGRNKVEKSIHDRMLNHVEKSIFRTYNVARYDEDARHWWQVWSDHVQGLAKKNVVPLRSSK